MIKKLECLFRTNSNTPSRETSENRDKINKLTTAVNVLLAELRHGRLHERLYIPGVELAALEKYLRETAPEFFADVLELPPLEEEKKDD